VNDYVKYYCYKCVYSVHVRHITDDARMSGVLDNFSGFPVKNFLGSLKGMVHKSQQVAQQIVRQISERELSDSIPEDQTVLKHQHKCGPDLICSNTQSQVAFYQLALN